MERSSPSPLPSLSGACWRRSVCVSAGDADDALAKWPRSTRQAKPSRRLSVSAVFFGGDEIVRIPSRQASRPFEAARVCRGPVYCAGAYSSCEALLRGNSCISHDLRFALTTRPRISPSYASGDRVLQTLQHQRDPPPRYRKKCRNFPFCLLNPEKPQLRLTFSAAIWRQAM